MNNFNFCVPTDIRFGRGQMECLPEELTRYGKKILLDMHRYRYCTLAFIRKNKHTENFRS